MAGLEPPTEGSLQISGQTHKPLRQQRPIDDDEKKNYDQISDFVELSPSTLGYIREPLSLFQRKDSSLDLVSRGRGFVLVGVGYEEVT
ncbi:hypothetical protein PoB_003018800 [Plakobranchus ocellatus]|uniref:Uncharacterized protein n=1 Tax=Plakobranchus ocellatus TaxID=259542 RepID=A0AAV4A8W5_9GAST|nr:hypothetical protein PoB_003018800 [Plakobranchus ocellatus]